MIRIVHIEIRVPQSEAISDCDFAIVPRAVVLSDPARPLLFERLDEFLLRLFGAAEHDKVPLRYFPAAGNTVQERRPDLLLLLLSSLALTSAVSASGVA